MKKVLGQIILLLSNLRSQSTTLNIGSKMKTSKYHALCFLLPFAAFSALGKSPSPKAESLGALYHRYEQAGFSTLSMPELNKTVLITGLAVKNSKSMTGKNLLSAASPDQPGKVIARLTASNEKEDATLAALPVNAAFNAACTLGFSSGAKYLSFSDCVFKK